MFFFSIFTRKLKINGDFMIYFFLDFLLLFALIVAIFFFSFNFTFSSNFKYLPLLLLLELFLLALSYVYISNITYIFFIIFIAINLCLCFNENNIKSLILYIYIYFIVWELELGLCTLFEVFLETLNVKDFNSSVMVIIVEILIPLLYITICFIIKSHSNQDLIKIEKTTIYTFLTVETLFLSAILLYDEIFFDLIKKKYLANNFYTYRTHSTVTFLLTILSIAICYSIIKNLQYDETLKANNILLSQQKIYFDDILKNELSMRRLKHDLNHHTTVIEQLVLTGDVTTALSYLSSIQDKLHIHDITYSCNNTILDTILNAYDAKIKENEITLCVDGTYPSDIEINAFDLCTIFSNLLLNAIEACSKVDSNNHRIINIHLNNHGLYVNIIFENTYKTISSNLITTKLDSFNHGIGLKNVKDSVKNNSGSIKITYDDNFFCVDILLLGKRRNSTNDIST